MPLQLKRPEELRVRDSELGVPNGDDETVYILRPITKSIVREQSRLRRDALRAATTTEAKAAIGDEADWLLDYAVVGWEGVLWEGEPAPCTSEMRRQLDPLRIEAIMRRVGLNEVEAAEVQRATSFRGPA